MFNNSRSVTVDALLKPDDELFFLLRCPPRKQSSSGQRQSEQQVQSGWFSTHNPGPATCSTSSPGFLSSMGIQTWHRQTAPHPLTPSRSQVPAVAATFQVCIGFGPFMSRFGSLHHHHHPPSSQVETPCLSHMCRHKAPIEVWSEFINRDLFPGYSSAHYFGLKHPVTMTSSLGGSEMERGGVICSFFGYFSTIITVFRSVCKHYDFICTCPDELILCPQVNQFGFPPPN